MSERWKSSRIGVLVLAAASVCAASVIIVIAVSTARLPYQLDYEEGNILNAALRIVRGVTIYPAPHSWPSVMNPYGPVGYELTSWMVRVGGVDLTLPRMMVIGCAVLCCVFVGVIVWREVRSGPAAVAFGALFLSFGAVFGWMPKLRMDLIALALVAVVMAIIRRKVGLPVLYLLMATLTTVTIGKAGSNYNHVVELSAAMCIAAAVGWKELAEAQDWKLGFAATVMVLLLAATVVNNAVQQPFPQRESGCDEAYTYVKNLRGERVITENLSAVVLGGKTLWISNPFIYTQLVKYGGWSDADLQQQLREHKVDLVIFDKDQEWSPGFLKELQENYRPDRTFWCRYATTAYVPKKAPNVSGR